MSFGEHAMGSQGRIVFLLLMSLLQWGTNYVAPPPPRPAEKAHTFRAEVFPFSLRFRHQLNYQIALIPKLPARPHSADPARGRESCAGRGQEPSARPTGADRLYALMSLQR